MAHIETSFQKKDVSIRWILQYEEPDLYIYSIVTPIGDDLFEAVRVVFFHVFFFEVHNKFCACEACRFLNSTF